MIVLALGRGLSGALRPRVVLPLWLLTVVLALPVAMAYGLLFHDGTSQLPDPAARAEGFQPPHLDDFERQEASALRSISDASGLASWTHVLVMGLLAGGLIFSFDTRGRQFREERGEKLELGTLLQASARHLGAMLVVLLVAIGAFALVDWLINGLFAGWLTPRFTRVEDERTALVVDWLQQGFYLLVLLFTASWLDLSRASIVIEGRSVITGLIDGLKSVVRHPLTILLGIGGLVLLEIVLTWLGARLLSTITTGSWGGLAAWFAGAQLLVLIRIVFGLWRLGTLTSVVEIDRDEREDRETALPGSLA
ncbi:MAG: hypothetical protein AAF533_12640 [Acidobacteriota bacterium]